MSHIFFQSGRRPIKVHVFEKPLTRAFQKYILLWVGDHSEKSYPSILRLLRSGYFGYFGLDTSHEISYRVDQKNKWICESGYWEIIYEGGVATFIFQFDRCTTFECTRTCSLMETLDMWYLRETSDCALDRSYHDSMVSTSVLGATALWKLWVDFLRRGKKVRQQLLAPGAPSWVMGK